MESFDSKEIAFILAEVIPEKINNIETCKILSRGKKKIPKNKMDAIQDCLIKHQQLFTEFLKTYELEEENVTRFNQEINKIIFMEKERIKNRQSEIAKMFGKSKSEPPFELMCPLTLDLFVEPVTSIYGNTYEKEAILTSLRFNQISPLTREVLLPHQLFPNKSIENLVRKWKLGEL